MSSGPLLTSLYFLPEAGTKEADPGALAWASQGRGTETQSEGGNDSFRLCLGSGFAESRAASPFMCGPQHQLCCGCGPVSGSRRAGCGTAASDALPSSPWVIKRTAGGQKTTQQLLKSHPNQLACFPTVIRDRLALIGLAFDILVPQALLSVQL